VLPVHGGYVLASLYKIFIHSTSENTSRQFYDLGTWGQPITSAGDISAGKPTRMVEEEMAVLFVTQLLG
jgi:hypothetical protein